MKHFIITLLLVFAIIQCQQAQSNSQLLIDSVLIELPSKSDDKTKVELLNLLANKYARINPQQGLIHGKEAIYLSENLGWNEGKAKAAHYVGFDYYMLWQLDSAIHYFNFADSSFEGSDLLVIRTRNYTGLGLGYEGIRDYPNSLKNYLKALNGYRKIGNRRHEAVGIYNAANIHRRLGEFSSALDLYSALLALSKEIEYTRYEARAYRGLGETYYDLSNFPKAIENDLMALQVYEELGDAHGASTMHGNIGTRYQSQQYFDEALKHYQASLEIDRTLNDTSSIALNLNNIGTIYEMKENDVEAIKHYQESFDLFSKLGELDGIALTTANMGSVYLGRGDLNDALSKYHKALQIAKNIDDDFHIGRAYGQLGQVYKLIAEDSIGSLRDSLFAGSDSAALKTALMYTDSSLQIFEVQSELKNKAFYLERKSVLESELGMYRDALISFKEHTEINDSLFNAERDKKLVQAGLEYDFARREDSLNLESEKKRLGLQKEIELRALQYEYEKKEAAAKSEEEKRRIQYEEQLKQQQIESDFARKTAEAEALARQKELEHEQQRLLAEARIKRQRGIRNFSLLGLIGVLAFSIVVFRQRNRVQKEKARVEKEKARSEELLLNILPAQVAEELKEKGAADAKLIDEVTVLFTDFKGFTALTEQMTPRALVKDIHVCFSAFDQIMEKHGIEKIKTIGDSYMAAGGLPIPNETHAVDIVNAALEIREFIKEGKARKIAAGLPYFEIRIGVHTGPVVAGIVGIKKFTYDIWGDTVNTASRMESSGSVGNVNISQSTYEILKDIPGYTFQSRGKIHAKGKGEMEMWFVEKTS